MIAALITCISVLTLLQFFVSYCHSVIAESRGYELSEQAWEVSGITSRIVHGDEFKRLLQLTALCPESGADRTRVRAVTVYFSLLELARMLVGWIMPAMKQWIESERGGCAYAAAVMLDRRITYSRSLMAHQAAPLL
jgi:hypothetical protein